MAYSSFIERGLGGTREDRVQILTDAVQYLIDQNPSLYGKAKTTPKHAALVAREAVTPHIVSVVNELIAENPSSYGRKSKNSNDDKDSVSVLGNQDNPSDFPEAGHYQEVLN